MHLKKVEIEAHLVSKGGDILDLPAKLLMQKAATLASMGSMASFEAIIAMIIHVLVLFPNIENFVDVNAMYLFDLEFSFYSAC